jgi:endonuclease/exonuclease/phosphatase family metal-dependent hydrolase
VVHPNLTPHLFTFDLPFLSTVHAKIAYLIFVKYVIIRFIVRRPFTATSRKYFSPASLFFVHTSRFKQFLSTALLAILLLNFLLIAIVNPSLLNPGPVNNNNQLQVFYQNVQGLIPFSDLGSAHPRLIRTKLLELNFYVHSKNPDIVILNETWLKRSIKDSEIFESSNYNVFRSDRSQLTHPCDPSNPKKFRKNGGGVLIAIRSDLIATCKRISMKRGAEILAIEVTVGESKLIICTCYRVGTLGVENHASIVSSIQQFFNAKKSKKIVLVGDFNLNSVTWPFDEAANNIINPIDKMFVDTFHEFGLSQCLTVPTHNKGRTLDLLLTNYESLISNTNVHDLNSVCKSDHFPISFDVKTRISRRKPTKRKGYNFKRANWDALNHDLCHVNWNAMVDCTEPEVAWSAFKLKLFGLVDRYIPTISFKSEFQPPWFDAEAFEACSAKEDARRKFKRTKSDLDGINFRLARRNFQNLASQKMRDNLYNDDDPALLTKKFWSHLKFTSNSHRLPECMYRDSCYRNSNIDKANLFNEFFYEQFSEISNYNIPIDFSSDESFEILFCHRRVRKLLSSINSNKACGPDGIHGKILKNCAVSLAYPLSLLFKISYNTGYVPREWKLGHIVPVYKKGPKANIENYRPISLTSLVMKTFERIIKDELLIRVNDMLNDKQHGFLNKKSCTTNMVGFCDSLALSLNDCERTDVVYFDFAKAFDSVNHDIILNKLKYRYNIDGRLLKFLANYLSNREQCVTIGNIKSSVKPVLSGVPQGSIIGPILFVIFINDMAEVVSPDTGLGLYADDTKAWRQINSEDDHIALQNDVQNLFTWSIENKMNFHPKKCKVVSVSNRAPPLLGILPCIQYFYYLGENPLDYADSERDLGVVINSKLNFSDQCNKLLSKAKQMLGLVSRSCYFVKDVKRRRCLYLSLIRSQFEHCSPVWRPTCYTMLQRFENLQKCCIKWILAEEYISYNTVNVYIRKCREVDLLPLAQRFDLNDLILFHKVVYNLIPLNFPSYLNFFDGNSRLRSCHLDHLSIVNTTCLNKYSHNLNKSFFYRTHTLWNALPLDIREIKETCTFKSVVTKRFWNSVLTDNDTEFDLNASSSSENSG